MNTFDQKLEAARKAARTRLLLSAGAVGLLVASAVITWLLSNSVTVQIFPEQARQGAEMRVSRGAGLVVFDAAYIIGSRATLNIEALGFISQSVEVRPAEQNTPLQVVMELAPPQVRIGTAPSLAQTEWLLNGLHLSVGEEFASQLSPGDFELSLNHPLYQPQVHAFTVELGRDYEQVIELQPVIGSLDIHSEPAGALLSVEGQPHGKTPVQIPDVQGGAYQIQLHLDGRNPIVEDIMVTNRNPRVRRNYRLLPLQTQLQVTVTPPDGTFSIDGLDTNLEQPVVLSVGREYIVRYEKPGYVTHAEVMRMTEGHTLAVDLQLAMAAVEITSTPAAHIFVNGSAAGSTPGTLQLQVLPQKISLQRKGYRTLELMVTPKWGETTFIEQALKSELQARLDEAPAAFTVLGIDIKLFDPRGLQPRFTMGASVRDPHRRADEFERQVLLDKPFYVSTTEITEAQFAAYQQQTAAVKAAGNLPVRNLSWIEAALFCNWLSAQEGLPLAYRFDGSRLLGFDRHSEGYRLLSEAEWEWLARVAGHKKPVRFVWGNQTQIPAKSGNFADQSAVRTVSQYIPNYKDGFSTVAPVASFDANRIGLYDLAGNVSEWVQDVYSLVPPASGVIERNPFAAAHGEGRVIKGSSFRSASVTKLRSSYREGLSQPRDDVGFRIARYLYGPDVQLLEGAKPEE